MINLGAIAIAMAVSGCRPQLVDCCLLALNIFDFKLAPSLIHGACNKAAAIPPLWHHAGCHLAGSVAGEKLFLSQTFFVLQSFITRSKARAPVMLLPWSRDAVVP